MKKSTPGEIWTYQVWTGAYDNLYSKYGERPVVIVVSTAFIDLTEKMSEAQKALGFETIWMTKKGLGLDKSPDDHVVADFSTIAKFVNARKRRDNVIFFMGHAACSFASIPRIRAACPDCKYVSYVGDWMQLFCPPEQIDLWKQYTPTGETIADEEYACIDKVISGELVDAVLYKDYGENFPMLSKCQSRAGVHWIPGTAPERIYQEPPREDVRDAICYIGTIVPKSTHGREAGLFDDIMMEDVFRSLVSEGYQVDAYSLTPHEDVIKEYREFFPGSQVKLYSGVLIPNLLPILQGQYKWGWMGYNWTTDLIMDHIKVTIPIKFFTYLALGVPIIVSREMEACGRIVDKYGCGVRVGQDELSRIREVTEAQDYHRLLNGVKMARRALNLGRFLPTVKRVLTQVLEMPYEETSCGREKAKREKEEREKEVLRKAGSPGGEGHPAKFVYTEPPRPGATGTGTAESDREGAGGGGQDLPDPESPGDQGGAGEAPGGGGGVEGSGRGEGAGLHVDPEESDQETAADL
jgi:hypothetical protein